MLALGVVYGAPRLSNEDRLQELGAEIGLRCFFTPGQRVDVSGVSKGKGFQGVVKRWNFKTQGLHMAILSRIERLVLWSDVQTPGEFLKVEKMSGQMVESEPLFKV